MTEKKANEIFRTKYPNGEICRKHSTSAENKYWVVFDTTKENHKVYYYSNTSYAELLNRLGFNVVYKHNVKSVMASLERYEKELEDAKNGKFKPFAFVFIERTPETEQAYIDELQKNVDECRICLKHYMEECVID